MINNRPAWFSWREALSGQASTRREIRQFLEIEPILDYNSLQPGQDATDAIRKTASDLGLSERGVTVRLTGTVPIADQEFGTLKEGAGLNTALTLLSVLIILWLALRSARIIFAVFVALYIGLAMTATLGLAMVGALNPISVAFFVLFVGIGVDFGLQFSVGYRAERFERNNWPRLSLRPRTILAAVSRWRRSQPHADSWRLRRRPIEAFRNSA